MTHQNSHSAFGNDLFNLIKRTFAREHDPFHEIIKRLIPIGRTAIGAHKNVEGGIVTHADIETAREILAKFEPLIADAAMFVREEKAA